MPLIYSVTAPPDPSPLDRLLTIMARLRHPETGCPWDVEQTFASIAPHTVEEAYEVLDAVENGTMEDLREELGDLLLHVVFHARMAEEAGHFAFADVATAIAEKLIRRHPHIFASATTADSAGVAQAWEALKAEERAAKAGEKPHSVLDGISTALPAITRALKLQGRAARVGFDWSEARDILGKIEEELDEVRVEFNAPSPAPDRLEDEIGDLLFSVVNLARKAGIDPESALRRTNRKFDRRFRFLEQALVAAGRSVEAASLEEMEALWQQAKTEAKDNG